jgi:hypothetical protein
MRTRIGGRPGGVSKLGSLDGGSPAESFRSRTQPSSLLKRYENLSGSNRRGFWPCPITIVSRTSDRGFLRWRATATWQLCAVYNTDSSILFLAHG